MSPTETYKVSDLCEAATDGDVERIKTMLDAQPDLVNVHMAEDDEHRAIHFAVMNQRVDAVRTLMKAGANHRSGIYPHRDATGALTMAEERGYDDIVRIIREEDEIRNLAACKNVTISPQNDALFDAIAEGHQAGALNILDEHPDLIDACHRDGGSAIYTAASHGRYPLILELLKRGADISHLTPEGASPLDGAIHKIRRRNKPINEGCLIAAGILLHAGCEFSLESAVALDDHDFVRNYAQTHPERFQSDESERDGLLQIAVEHHRVDMLRLLLDLGLHPDDRHQKHDYESKPHSWGEPLWLAAGDSLYEIAELLLDRGADPNASVYASGNPLERAYNNQDDRMKGLLFRYGGALDPTTAGLEGETAAAAVALNNDPSLAEQLLWAAGCGGDLDIAGMCLRELDWGPDDPSWFSLLEQPLRLWRTNPHRKFRNFDRSVYPEIFRMILDHGVSPNLVGRFGYRLAHRLAACGVAWGEPVMTETDRINFAEILLDHGADLDVTDDLLQSSPLGWAARWGRYELARCYLEHGADPTLAAADWATPLVWAEKRGYSDISDLIGQYI